MEKEIDRQIRSCPLNGKTCCDGIRDDFEKHPITKQQIKCRWWVHLTGKDPQSEKNVDEFDCSIAWLPIIGLENSQMIRFNAASTDKVANNISKVHKSFLLALPESARNRLMESKQKIIEQQKIKVEQ